MANVLGKLEARFFSYIQSRKQQTVFTGDLHGALGLTPAQEKRLLSRLAAKGLIARVRRGLYLAPPTLPAGGKWSPGEILAITALVSDQNGKYQICGPNAFSRYGWVEQVPMRVYAYNNRISGERRIGVIHLTLIKVADERLGATEVVRVSQEVQAVYSSKARSLMDAVYDWSRFNSLPRGFDWIRTELSEDERIAAELINVCLRYGNQGTLRRIGKLLEMAETQEALLRKLEKALRPTSSPIPWVPTRPKRGKIDRRWGIVLNHE